MCKSNFWIRCVQTPPIILILGKASSTTTKEIHIRISAMSSTGDYVDLQVRGTIGNALVEKQTLCL